MERPILYVNACVREGSRTRRLAEALLKKLGAPYEEVRLEDIAFPAVDEAFLNRRDRLAAGEEADDGMLDLARQFARAEIIESIPAIDGTIRSSRREAALAVGGEARLSPPRWTTSRYRVTLTRTAGRWMISNLQLIEQIEE